MRIMGSRFQPSARSVPPERAAPMVCAVSRELRYPVKRPLRDDRRRLRRHAFIVIGEGPEPRSVFLPRVGHDVDQFAAVAQIAQLLESKKRSARKICFHAEHAIQFNRMPDGFVNLQAQLRSIQNDCGRAFRALVRMMQRDGLFRHAPRILHQFHFFDQFIAAVLPLPAKRVRIRPLLNLRTGKRIRRIARAGRIFCLMNVSALGRKKPRLFALKVHAGFGERDARNGAHLRVHLQQQIEILLHRRGEGIDFVRCRPLRHRRGLGSQANILALHPRRGSAQSRPPARPPLPPQRGSNPRTRQIPTRPPAITRTPMPSDSDSEA